MKSLNIPGDAITKQKDIDRWGYLGDVKLPVVLDDSIVELLIGVDVTETLEIEKVILGQDADHMQLKRDLAGHLVGQYKDIRAKVSIALRITYYVVMMILVNKFINTSIMILISLLLKKRK